MSVSKTLALIVAATLAGALLAGCGSASPALPPFPTAIPRTPVVGEGPLCQFDDWIPLHDTRLMCLEQVYDASVTPQGAPELGGLAFAPDGTLYVTATADGAIWALRDANGDGFMEAPTVAADGLTLPTALTLHEGALYVASVGGVVRLDERDAAGHFAVQTTLIDALPYDTGYWPGAIGVGPDGRLYVSVGASCATCSAAEDVRPGYLFSAALDGRDMRVEATGFAQPGGFGWHPATGALWLVDGGAAGTPAEVNAIVPGADYGFPRCPGDDALRDPDSEACAGTEPPAALLPAGSNPAAALFYDAAAYAIWQGDLLVPLRGSEGLPEPAGYALAAVTFADGAATGAFEYVVPSSGPPIQYRTLAAIGLFGRGLYPLHPSGVAVSPEGWIYLALQEGQILRIRPRATG